MGDGAFTADEIAKALTRLGLETDSDDSTLRSTVDSSAQPGNPGLTFADFEALHKSLRADLVSRVQPESSPVPEKFTAYDVPDFLLMLDFNKTGDAKAPGRCCVVSKRFHLLDVRQSSFSTVMHTIPVATREEGQNYDSAGLENRLFFGLWSAFGKSTPKAPTNA